MLEALIHPVPLFQSRKAVNALYLLVPPVGVLAMCLSPAFSNRERLVRAAFTAGFLAFFTLCGPELHAYLHAQTTALAAAH